jgi:hypothetical protein
MSNGIGKYTASPGGSFVVEVPIEGPEVTAEVGASVECIIDDSIPLSELKTVKLTPEGARALREILSGNWKPSVEVRAILAPIPKPKGGADDGGS